MEIPAKKKELFVWKAFFITFLTAWIMIADMNQAFVVSRVFFDVSPTATGHRVMLYGTDGVFDHPDLESVTPSVDDWNKADVSHKWAYLEQAYGAESQVLFRYTNNNGMLVYVSLMRTDSEKRLVHGLKYCYGLQGYSSISKSIINIEPSEGLPLPINLWFVQRPGSAEGWVQAFWYVASYREGTVERAYFAQVQVYVPAPGIREEATQIAVEFAQHIAIKLLRFLIPDFEASG